MRHNTYLMRASNGDYAQRAGFYPNDQARISWAREPRDWFAWSDCKDVQLREQMRGVNVVLIPNYENKRQPRHGVRRSQKTYHRGN